MNSFHTIRKTLLIVIWSLAIAGNAELDAQPGQPGLSAGREFVAAFPANWDSPTAAQYYIRLYVTSEVRTRVYVWVGQTIKKVFYTKPYEVVTVDLAPIEAQMFTRNDVAPVPPDSVYRGRAIRIVSEDPIMVYGMNRTSFTSDGMLLLPIHSLGREYVVPSYPAVSSGTQELPSQLMVIAPFNNTVVTIIQPMRTPNHGDGEVVRVRLDRGDVYSAMTLGYGGDMSGAIIRSNRPVAVTAGNSCTYIPNQINFCCCDHITEMILPVDVAGKSYVAPHLESRTKGAFYRVFATKPGGTNVSINGVQHAKLPSIGGGEGVGWFEYRPLGTEPVEITGDRPITVVQYNPSQAYDGVPSDPFFLQVLPSDQFEKQLFLATPGADFPLNYASLVCDSARYREIEVSSDGGRTWLPLWSRPWMRTPIPLRQHIDGRPYQAVTGQIPPGVYVIRGPLPMAAHLYGFSAYDSYGYPAAASLLNKSCAAPSVQREVDCSGNIAVIRSTNLTGTTAALANVEVLSTENCTAGLMPQFAADRDTMAYVTLQRADSRTSAFAVVQALDTAGNVVVDTITWAAKSQIQGTSLDFGAYSVGTSSSTGMVAMRNLGNRAVTIWSLQLTGGDTGAFKILAPTQFPIVLQPGAEVQISVQFLPPAPGAFGARIVAVDTCGSSTLGTVNGRGVLPSGVEAPAPVEISVQPSLVRGIGDATLHLDLAKPAAVSAELVDNAGRVVREYLGGTRFEAGTSSVRLDLTGLAAGAYFCRVNADGNITVHRVVLAR